MINSKGAASRLSAAGYVSHLKREACRWCAHGTVVMHGPTKRVSCRANGAIVSCGGLCRRFARVADARAA